MRNKNKKKMTIFSILKIHDEYSVMHYPFDELRLDPSAIPLKKSGVPTCPLDRITFILIQYVIF
jgi:hypothetical protein